MKWTTFFVMISAFCFAEFTESYSYYLSPTDKEGKAFIWEVPQTRPFNELLLAWNSFRPKQGKLTFYVAVKTNDWSDWIPYSEWSAHGQKSFPKGTQPTVANFIDCVETVGDCIGKAFRVKVASDKEGNLQNLDALHICISELAEFVQKSPSSIDIIHLNEIHGRSQMVLNHPRNKDMCSPTSTSTVVSFLGGTQIDPVAFANDVYDQERNIYGNWALNVAQAYDSIKGKCYCRMMRLNSFDDLISYLLKNTPVVVSVKGSIKGAPQAYNSGHLMVITGYDPINQKVHCIDSAWECDKKTKVSYNVDTFLEAWGTRKNLAYIFENK